MVTFLTPWTKGCSNVESDKELRIIRQGSEGADLFRVKKERETVL